LIGQKKSLEEWQENDIGGKALKRFAQGLPKLLKPDGFAMAWNSAFDKGLDSVERTLKLDGRLDVVSEKYPGKVYLENIDRGSDPVPYAIYFIRLPNGSSNSVFSPVSGKHADASRDQARHPMDDEVSTPERSSGDGAMMTEAPPAALAFMIADLKLTQDGEVKILEFGGGMESQFQGYLPVNDGIPMMNKFWMHVKNDLKLPVWYTPSDTDLTTNEREFYKEKAVSVIKYGPDSYVGHIGSFENAIARGEWGKKKPNFDPKDLSTYSGILIYRGNLISYREMVEVMKKYPWIIMLDEGGATRPYIGNKLLTKALIKKQGLEDVAPKWRVYPTVYKSNMANKVKTEIPSARYVIKPFRGTGGQGVIVVEADELDSTLKRILTSGEAEVERIRKEEHRDLDYDDPYEHWLTEKQSSFTIETMESSKPIDVGGKEYDATMRMVFTLEYTNGEVNVNVIDGYWKLPSAAIGEGELRDAIVSKIEGEEESSAKISDSDKELVSKRLKEIIAKKLASDWVKMN